MSKLIKLRSRIMAFRFVVHVVRNHWDQYRKICLEPKQFDHNDVIDLAHENPCCARYMPKGWDMVAW